MRYWGWVAALAMIVPVDVGAGSLEAEVAELRRQVALLAARLEQVEQAERTSTVAAATALAAATPRPGPWSERITIKGDFRYRHDYIDVEGASTRNRQRNRARIGASARIGDDMEAGLQLASGPTSPTTTNQTLGNAASTKDIRLDLAYLSWKTPIEGLVVTGGRFKNPLYRPAPLVWDSDVNPEGIAAHYDAGDVFATAMAFWTVERSSDDDSFMLGAQLGWRREFEGGPRLLLGASFYEHTNIRGEAPLFDANPRGNGVDVNGNYLFGFRQVEVFGEIDLADLGVPVSLFGQYVKNTDAGTFDRAFAFGAGWSPVERWGLAYSYRDVDRNAVLGIFTDSDFGLGITDASGHVFESSFYINDAVAMKMTYFNSETGGSTGSGIDVDRVFLDFNFKY